MRSRVVLAIVALLLCSRLCWADIYIVANPEVPIGKLTMEEVKNVFLGQKIKWNDDLKVQLTLVKDPKPHSEFAKNFVGKSTAQFENWWRNMVFTGKGSMPKSFASEQEAIQYIAQTPGAIGYLAVKPDVTNIKVLVIEE